jgi:hypothetical protein
MQYMATGDDILYAIAYSVPFARGVWDIEGNATAESLYMYKN